MCSGFRSAWEKGWFSSGSARQRAWCAVASATNASSPPANSYNVGRMPELWHVPAGRSAARRLRAVGEQQVERPAGVAEDRRRGGALGIGAGAAHLADGAVQLLQQRPEVGARSGGLEAGERVGRRLAARRDVLAAGVGERDELAARLGGDDDQSLVLELVDGRVDRAGTGRPAAATALGDRLHQLVAVHGLLGEELEDGRADVAARGSPTAAVPGAAEALRRHRTAAAGVVEAVAGLPVAALVHGVHCASPCVGYDANDTSLAS